MHWIDAACTLGATQAAACMAVGITAGTLQR